MSMKAVVQRAIAKHTVDVSKAPFLTMLLQPASKRNFTKEIEQWISEHDVVALLENLASHLLRSLPTDEMDETDRWIDAQKKSRGGVSAIAEADIVDRVSLENDGTRSVEEARWLGREVTVLTVFRKLPSSSAKDASRSHVHRIACMAASLPLLPPLRHENLLPCLGYSVGEAVLSTVHPKLTDVKSVRDMLQQQQQCSLLTPHVSVAVCLRMASDVLNALSYLHALGFLHRHLTLDSVFYVKEGTLQESSRPVPQAGRFVLGGFDFMVRTSRGHFTSHAWMPKNAPPETLQTRTYTTASDIFGVGMLVLECANYGSPVDCCVGVPSRPDWLPSALWDGLLSSALALVADNRPSASELRNTIEELLQTQEALGRAIIATPAERQHINSDELTALVVSGAPQDITTTEHIELCGSTIKWELACKAAAGNQHVTTLCVADCSIPRNTVLPRWAALTQLKLRAVCRVSCPSPRARQHSLVTLIAATLQPCLTTLDLSDNEWEESELIELIDALCAKCCLLRELRLADCGCSTPVVRHLCEVLTPKPDKCTPLGCLDVLGVGGASLTYMGLTYMAGWLRQAAALGTLDLSHAPTTFLTITVWQRLEKSFGRLAS